jgi:branched-chain amino acid transport system ATP-binding protein
MSSHLNGRDGPARAMLAIEGLTKSFGAHRVLRDVALSVREGDVHAVIGPNGAGKTTLVNVITGVHAPSAGKVSFGGEDVTSLPIHHRARRGLSRTFQITNLFGDLTARENVEVALVGYRKYRRAHLPDGDSADMNFKALLDLVGLSFAAEKRADRLSHGDQRLLEVAVAMASRPKLLLLDEPSAGMSPAETSAFIALVNAQLRRRVTVILVEHDMAVVTGTADRISVLAAGNVLADGPPAEVLANSFVREVYLGRA